MLGAVPRPIPGAGSPSSALSMDLGVTRGGGLTLGEEGCLGWGRQRSPSGPTLHPRLSLSP